MNIQTNPKLFCIAMFALVGTFVFSPALALPLIDLEAKYQYWQTGYDGEIGASNSLTTRDLGLDQDTANSISIRLEHPVPVLPNIQFRSTRLANKGSATLSAGEILEIDELNFANERVTTDLDLSHKDLTLYYSIAWFDLGVTARSFDSTSTFTGATTGRTEVELKGVVPMLYAGIGLDLPLTGLYTNAEVNIISVDGSSFQDIQAGVGYKFGSVVQLGTELGYRRMSVALDSYDDLEADLAIDGWYLSLGLLL